jgi:Immunity protein family (Imm11)
VYYVLTYQGFSDGEAQQLERPVLPGRDEIAFDEGVWVPDPPPSLRFLMTQEEHGELGDLVPTYLPGLVISERFRQLLDEAGVDNVQYIPAEIEDRVNGGTLGGYFVANVVGLVDCIDMAKSKLTLRAAPPGAIRFIRELHIDESRARDLPLFRLERKSSLILMSERVQRKIAAAKLRGVGLLPAEGYAT